MKNAVYINSMKIFPFRNSSQLIDYVRNRNGILIAINAEKNVYANKELKTLVNKNIGYADGTGIVLALKRKGFPNVVKIPGCELWLELIEEYYKYKTFYLIGAKEVVVQEVVRKIRSNFPGIQILGYRNGYIKSMDEKNALISDIIKKKPDVVFVAMGSPKQEMLMQELSNKHSALYQGLGGSFDIFTGGINRAPSWWLSHQLEWAYRLLLQPWRIRRQMRLIPFFLKLIFNKI